MDGGNGGLDSALVMLTNANSKAARLREKESTPFELWLGC